MRETARGHSQMPNTIKMKLRLSRKRCHLMEESLEPNLLSRMVLWVFGYGSLLWNPGFNACEKIVGYIKDYRRVFDLACIEHRGTAEFPARICTLKAQEGAICWGRAYCVKGGPEKENSAMKYLEKRECEYDLKAYVDFYTEEGDSATPFLTAVLVFTSTPNKNINKYYLGPASLEEMAREILKAVGPCGNNCDYLFKLEETMLSIGHADDEVNKLANEVRRILGVGHKVFHRSAL